MGPLPTTATVLLAKPFGPHLVGAVGGNLPYLASSVYVPCLGLALCLGLIGSPRAASKKRLQGAHGHWLTHLSDLNTLVMQIRTSLAPGTI